MFFFQPAIGIGGYGGWRVLETTGDRQRETFNNSPFLEREIEYFRENIKSATSAEALVKDRRLLGVALGAFGLDDEINKGGLIRKVLEDGTQAPGAFANRLADQRYRDLADAFDYGNITAGTNIQLDSFVEDVVARYKSLQFERAVGETDEDMRLALTFKRQIADIASGPNAENTGWFQVMGNLPLRTLAATALGIPESVSQLDLDKQREIFEDRAAQVYGDKSVAAFLEPDNVEDAIRRFFLFRQVQNGPSALTPGLGALTLLQSSGVSGNGLANLLLSQR